MTLPSLLPTNPPIVPLPLTLPVAYDDVMDDGRETTVAVIAPDQPTDTATAADVAGCIRLHHTANFHSLQSARQGCQSRLHCLWRRDDIIEPPSFHPTNPPINSVPLTCACRVRRCDQA